MKLKEIICSTALTLVVSITGGTVFTENVHATDAVPQSADSNTVSIEEKHALIEELSRNIYLTPVHKLEILNGKLHFLMPEDEGLANTLLSTIRKMCWITDLSLFPYQFASLPRMRFPQNIKKLNLSHGKMTSLSELEHFTSLEKLNLSCCSSSVDLGWMRANNRLRRLYLHGTHVKSLDVLMECPNLEELDISSCHVVRLQQLPASLKVLDMSDSFTEIPLNLLRGCPNLKSLNLSGRVHLRNLGCVSDNKELNVLRLFNTSVTSLSALKGCEKLEELDLMNCNGLKDLKGVPASLRILDVRGSRITSLNEVEGCTSLEKLDASYCGGLKDLKGVPVSLRILNIRKSGITSLNELEGCTSLEELDASHCEGLKDLRGVPSSLKILNIRKNGIASLNGVEGCTSLEELNASGCNNLKNEDFEKLLALPKLRTICAPRSNHPGDISEEELVARFSERHIDIRFY
ncbi:MAG: hypothetical protein LBB21_05570 [Holosporaceae bacterium]|jgi:internalin A|nr:hypothetical protein [Holosporaceae bacterium]